MVRRVNVTIVAAVVLILSTLLAYPTAAQAANYSGRFTNTVRLAGTGMHTCPRATCSHLEVNGPGKTLLDYCYVQGDTLNGNPFWDLVWDPTTKRAGWTNEGWLSTVDVQYRHCSWNSVSNEYGTITAKAGAGMHECRSNTCALTGYAAGHTLTSLCWMEDGQWLGSPSSNRWYLVYDATEGVRNAGWTNANWLTGGLEGYKCTDLD